MFVGAIVPVIAYKLHYWVERTFKIDDAVGAVAVHGYCGFLGVVVAGFLLWGAPSFAVRRLRGDLAVGQHHRRADLLLRAGVHSDLILSLILKALGLLRVPREVEIFGLDIVSEEAYEASIAEVKEAERAALAALPAR